MPKKGPLSIEVGHMYLDRMSEEIIDAEAARAKRLIEAHVGEDRVGRASKVVLIDNYNRYSNPLVEWEQAEDAQQAVVAAFEDHGILLDHVVWEGSLADTVHHMLDLLVPEPRRGDGSRQGSSDEPLWQPDAGWLSNGDEARPQEAEFTGGLLMGSDDSAEMPQDASVPRHRHSIALDVELWSEEDGIRRWACPVLAAWWQLVRLGALNHVDSRSSDTPRDTWSRPGGSSLSAFRTITFLESNYIEVEHAVWNILRQVALPDEWANSLRDSREETLPRAHLERMSYVFSPARGTGT